MFVLNSSSYTHKNQMIYMYTGVHRHLCPCRSLFEKVPSSLLLSGNRCDLCFIGYYLKLFTVLSFLHTYPRSLCNVSWQHHEFRYTKISNLYKTFIFARVLQKPMSCGSAYWFCRTAAEYCIISVAGFSLFSLSKVCRFTCLRLSPVSL